MADVRIRWNLDVVDRGAGQKILRQDRQIRRGLEQTDKQYRRTATAATSAAARQASASQRAAGAVSKEGHAARTSSGDFRRLNEAQRQTLAIGQRIITQAGRQADAVEKSARRQKNALRGVAGVGTRGVRGGVGVVGAGTAALGLGGVGIGAAAATGGIAKSIAEFDERRKIANQTRAVLKSTRSEAGLTVAAVEKLSDSLGRQAGVEGDVVQQGANMLLTFTQIKNEGGKGGKVFDRATAAAVDMSAAFNAAGKSMDLASASMQIGKALNDPEKGFKRLQRIGVSFTADQEKQIKTMQKAGDTAGAQRVILRELEREFGGSAKATATPLDRMKVSVDEIAESVGRSLAPTTDRAARTIGKFLDEVREGRGAGGRFADRVRDIAGSLRDTANDVKPVVVGIGKFVAAHPGLQKVAVGLIAAGVALKALRFAGAITGVTRLIRLTGKLGGPAGRLAARGLARALETGIDASAPGIRGKLAGVLRRAGSRGGAAGGTAASARMAEGLADNIGPSMDARSGRIKGRFRKIGRVAGRAFGLAAAIAIPLIITDALNKSGALDKVAETIAKLVGAGPLSPAQQRSLDNALWNQPTPKRKPTPVIVLDPRNDPGRRKRGGGFIVGGSDSVDGTPIWASGGEVVLTYDGQRRIMGGEPLGSVVANQAPHFKRGGVVPGRYTSTAYGPPWGGIQGTGVTRTGVDLRDNPHVYGIAVDPSRVPLGSAPYVWPNPFRYSGRFRAFDTGGAIQGNRIDFYDWRGRTYQNRWGRRDVRVSGAPIGGRSGGKYDAPGDAGGGTPSLRVLGRSRTRGALSEDPVGAGIEAGTSGLTRAEIRRGVAGRRGARANPIIASIREQLNAMRPQSSSPAERRSSDSGGVPRQGDPGSGGNKSLMGAARMAQNRHMRVGENPAFGGVHGGHSPTSWHNKGRAIDVTPRPPTSIAALGGYAQAVASKFGSKLLELFWRGKNWVNIKNGRRVGHDFVGAMFGSDKHTRHVHVALRRGGRVPRFRGGGVVGRRFQLGGPVARAASRPTDPGGSPSAEARRRRLKWAAQHDRPIPDMSPTPRHQGVRRGTRREIVGPVARASSVGDLGASAARAPRGGSVIGRDLSAGLGAVTQFKGGSFDALDATIGAATEARLAAFRKKVLGRVRAGGPERVVRRLQGVVDLIDFEIGRRIGRLNDVIARRSAALERRTGAASRLDRRAGVDPSSAAGLTREGFRLGLDVIPTQEANVRSAASALRRAQGTGDRSKIREALDQLHTAQDDLDESLTRRVELRRDLIRAQTQERVDTAQFGVDVAQNTLAGLDVSQRLRRNADTPQGMTERAVGIGAQLIPALTARRDAAMSQAMNLGLIGDTAGARQAFLDVQSAGNDIATAMADAADLIRDAALTAAQDTVDAAAHGSTMTDLSRQRLDLEQRIAGTYESGGVQRADFIRTQVIPALTAELTALQGQAAAAAEQGDTKLATQIAESIAGKQNDILQATLDATEEVASNTEPRKFGGTLGFAYGDQNLTDALIGLGSNA